MSATMTPEKVELKTGETFYTIRKAQQLISDLLHESADKLRVELSLAGGDLEKANEIIGKSKGMTEFAKELSNRLNKYMTI